MTGQTLDSWVVAAVAAGVLGVLAFLARNAFVGFTDALKDVASKVTMVAEKQTAANLHTAGFEAEVRAELRGLREGLGRSERDLRERQERLEREMRDVREVSEGVAR